MSSTHDGPDLQQYIETRLNLLTEALKEARAALDRAMAEADRRYEQRWEAMQRERDIAFIAQKTAMETALAAQKEAVTAAMASADRAVSKAETSSEKRFESVNEFRNTLADQQRNLMPRAEVDVLFRGMHDKLGALEKHIDTIMAERAGIKGGWGYAVGVVGFVLTIGSLIVLVLKATGR